MDTCIWRMDTCIWRMDTWTWRMDTWIWRMDTLLEGWTPYLTDGHHTWRMDTILDGWTPYLTDGHHTWRMDTILDGRTLYLTNEYFYFHELFICLIFSLLKEIPAFSNLYSFYCLTIIIYSFLKRRRLPCNLKYNQKFFMSLFWRKKLSDHESDINMYQEFKIVQ